MDEEQEQVPGALALVQGEVEWVTAAAEQAVEFMVTYSFQIVGAVIIMIVGYLVSNRAGNGLLRLQAHRYIDVTLRPFISSAVRLLLRVMFVTIWHPLPVAVGTSDKPGWLIQLLRPAARAALRPAMRPKTTALAMELPPPM